jgi:molecular chaperone DnaJ
MEQDYYNILNVTESASADEIKKSYRKLAIKWHPDKNQGNPEAEEQFKKISEAYDVLSDENKKAQYDQFGHAAFKQQGQGGGRHHDPFDMFNSFFGGGGGNFDSFFTSDNRKKRQPTQGSDLKIDIEVKLSEIINESHRTIKYTRNGKCNSCNGTGETSTSTYKQCKTCNGHGIIYRRMGPMQMEQTCPSCEGTGQELHDGCVKCQGQGVITEKIETRIKIPKGCHTGVKLRVSKHGNYIKGGGFGDLYAVIYVKKDEYFERDGDHLICEEHIDFYDMILGENKVIKSLYGKVNLKIPTGTQPDSILRVIGHGLPRMRSTESKGDLYVIIKPIFPRKISNENRSILELYKKSN